MDFKQLREEMQTYTHISDESWSALREISIQKQVKKGTIICHFNDIATDLLFVQKGLLRAYILDEEGHEYNKNFFLENNFAGSTVSLLTQTPSYFEIEALEDSTLIMIEYAAFRKLLLTKEDLKLFQILYLEKNWVIQKESREVDLVQKSATQRYETFLITYPTLEARIPQYLIASHLGITPTQLSRIRKSINIGK